MEIWMILTHSITLGISDIHRTASSWWLQMTWRQIGARPSATTTLTRLCMYAFTHMSHVAWHAYHVTAIKTCPREVGGGGGGGGGGVQHPVSFIVIGGFTFSEWYTPWEHAKIHQFIDVKIDHVSGTLKRFCIRLPVVVDFRHCDCIFQRIYIKIQHHNIELISLHIRPIDTLSDESLHSNWYSKFLPTRVKARHSSCPGNYIWVVENHKCRPKQALT